VIELSNVTKRFYALTAIDNVSLRIPRGEVLGLLGPNGAGKTTLFKLMAGLLYPDTGQLKPTGSGWPIIGYKPERLLFPNRLRVVQYLELVAGVCNVHRSQVEQAVMESLVRVDLLDAANKQIKECSKGMRQRLGLAQALIGDPPMLLLDEPSNGLDPEGQADIHHRIKRLHSAGKTIVISSHQLQEITQVCTQLVILNRGQIHYQNNMSEALATRTHTLIQADRDISSMSPLLEGLHSGVRVDGDSLVLRDEAMAMRRQILVMLLDANYDVVHVEEKRITLAEIYAEAVQ
jgi:ABC-type multidrug transport system ATPase subunit